MDDVLPKIKSGHRPEYNAFLRFSYKLLRYSLNTCHSRGKFYNHGLIHTFVLSSRYVKVITIEYNDHNHEKLQETTVTCTKMSISLKHIL